MKKVISLLLVLTVICASLVFASVTVNADSVIESALSWALNIANDDSHQYVLGASHSETEGTNYDCSSFVSWALRHAGLNVPISTTFVMRKNFEPYGFEWIPWSSIGGTSNLQRGDILLDESTHVEFYYGNNQMLGAHNPRSGISVYGYYNNAYGVSWNGVLRLHEGNDPQGVIDGAVGGVGTVHVTGWAFDKDDLNAQLNIHVYIGGSSGDSNADASNSTWANVGRADVNKAYGCGDYHGYDAVIPTTKTGTQTVYVYAINVGGGSNKLIGTKTVNITADTEKPTVKIKYFDQVKTDGFWPCFTLTDNVGIESVRVATWTQDDQSDLIWHNATNNGHGTYFVMVKRSDYSKTKNSIYHNHAYIYDYAGNCTFSGIDMDYRIKSDTGKNIPEGEYRIITAVNENRALDVAN